MLTTVLAVKDIVINRMETSRAHRLGGKLHRQSNRAYVEVILGTPNPSLEDQ